MNTPLDPIAAARRVVVKIGSSSLTSIAGGIDAGRLTEFVASLAAHREAGREIVVVSSGAIAAGLAPLGITRRPRDLATAQAAATVGQLLLVQAYAAAFAAHGATVGQVLLTADDLHRRSHYRNASRTIAKLLALGVVPVVNENDTVATEEIRFGDNDRLAALVAHVAEASGLVLLSDVDGLHDGDPHRSQAVRVPVVNGAADLRALAIGSSRGDGVGRGGMSSKVEAAMIASSSGVSVRIARAEDVRAALDGDDVGTLFPATGRRPTARLFWLRYASRPRGSLVLDAGAVRALRTRRASLLAAGVTGVGGDFLADDPVELLGPDGMTVGRGLVAYDARELPAILGKSTSELSPELRREVVHRDEMVLHEPSSD
ncbi:MAG: glutamate 5-kinase [Geodermatophilaceae bacterium]|nr:glutamate 5-kinase [Geodermatophilaceae bacterium]